MQVLLKSYDNIALDKSIKELLKYTINVKNIKLLHKTKDNKLRRLVICDSIKVSVITKLQLPEMVHISIQA